MPRDDLSIDFVQRMPQAEPLDPSLILDDWINRVQNFPEEIRFMQDEIADKDRQYNECVRTIEDRDAKIQKWIKTNGSHEPNPKEDNLRAQIRENYAKADRLAQEKIEMARKLQITMDKHLRSLDIQIKLLYDRAEPGFTDPDEVPSLLRASAANIAAPSIRSANASSMTAAPALAPITTGGNPAFARLPTHPHVRQAQTQQLAQQQQALHQQTNAQHAASAPATPAASMILNRHREGSAGPATKRGPRVAPGVGATPTTSSGLARHSSLGPGTPKNSNATGPSGTVRAGSAGPRATTTKLGNGPGSRRGTPTAPNRKKPPHKSKLSRVKKASARNSPASTGDSDLSEAESGSGDDAGDRSGSAEKDADGDEALGDADEEEEDGGDDKKYCLCHNVSHGDMVACDNDNCPYEWFHWSCVGLKSEPNGTWYCPACSEKLAKKAK